MMRGGVTGERRTNVLLARALEWDLGADDADEDAHLVAVLVNLVRGPVDAAQRRLGDHIRTALLSGFALLSGTKYVIYTR